MELFFLCRAWWNERNNYTQVAQYCVLIFAFTVPAIFISLQATGNPIPQIGLEAKPRWNISIRKFKSIIVDLGFEKYTDINQTTLINVFFITAALMFGTAGLLM
ncbi:MAG: hypothetical protein CM15mP102_08160 [Flavobacteriales bacterium]|nr:MAG: hypothetical protein CM15mP102_08160 [Flavobacteriales bacterium]